MGGDLFVGRLGLAAFARTRWDRQPRDGWSAGLELRRRGPKGYVGAGARYLRFEDRWYASFGGGAELPPLKAGSVYLPTFGFFDVLVEDWRWRLWKGVRFTLGVRLDVRPGGGEQGQVAQ